MFLLLLLLLLLYESQDVPDGRRFLRLNIAH